MIILVELKAWKKREEEGNEEKGGRVVAAQHGVEKGKPRWSSTTGRPRRCILANLSVTEKNNERKKEEDMDNEKARRKKRESNEGREKSINLFLVLQMFPNINPELPKFLLTLQTLL